MVVVVVVVVESLDRVAKWQYSVPVTRYATAAAAAATAAAAALHLHPTI